MSNRRLPRCSVRRCDRIARVVGLCKTHAKQRADSAFSVWIRNRDGKCLASGSHWGPLQCAHILSRRYLATRWEGRNAVTLCRSHHAFYTYHPIEWDLWVETVVGRGTYSGLRDRALRGERPDLADVLRRLAAS